jgi:hypothetical protein
MEESHDSYSTLNDTNIQVTEGGGDWKGMWHVWGKENCTQIVVVGEIWGLEDLVLHGRIILEWILKKCDERV